MPAQFRVDYAAALDEHVASPGEETLRLGYELGRRAVAEAISALDLGSLHHAALGRSLEAGDRRPAEVLEAAAPFFQEVLSAYEMVHRGYREAARAAAEERRQAAMLRQLSSFLSDASLTAQDADGVEEVLHLVLEYARDLTDAVYGIAVYTSGHRRVQVTSSDESPDTSTDEVVDNELTGRIASASTSRRAAALSEPIIALDGSELGFLRLVAKARRHFTDADVAVVSHLCRMAAASLERAQLYRTAL